jgi:hypothetical protein
MGRKFFYNKDAKCLTFKTVARKGASFGFELVKAEEENAGKFALVPTYYRLWKTGDPKLSARRCTGS